MNPAVATETPSIRPLQGLAELEACFRLQEEVWGRGFREAASVSILKAAQRLGGILGGALDASGELVGFVFGLTGMQEGRVVHWSHMLAVRPGLRDAGLGRRLKAWQRQQCRAIGVERMYWTFDPLESRNGWLNLGRLGVFVREYVEDMYGASDSPLHEGLGTDRFVALWLLDSARVEQRLNGGAPTTSWSEVKDLPVSFPVLHEAGLPRPGPLPPTEPDEGEAVLVPIPGDIHRMKALDPELAIAWRTATRGALMCRIARGWEVRELVRATESVSYYLLRRTGAED
jgi:predicted GNAT superfamily acetyltransferase